MSRRIGHALLLLAAVSNSPGWSSNVDAFADSQCGPDGQQPSGAVYRICMPALNAWNGDLVVYAHGYVAVNRPIAIPEDQLSIPGGPSLPAIANGLGYAFATTSYRVNGLAVRQGLDDVVELVAIFAAEHGWPGHVYLVGASEGGLITALGLEQHADVFDGGLSVCGPVGNFRWQLNYWGDARVLFDYYFPGVIPGSAVDIPQEVMDQWESVYQPRVEAALRSEPARMKELLRVAQIPSHPTDAEANVEAIMDLLWYNVFSTNDGLVKLGGLPYDNTHSVYRGSSDDRALNRDVRRFHADAAAVIEVDQYYQTSGKLGGPLVTLHTLGDPVVPYWHEWLYAHKLKAHAGPAFHLNLPVVLRYGHCNVGVVHALLGFVWLVYLVTGDPVPDAGRVLATAAERDEFRALTALHGPPIHGGYTLYLPLVRR